MRRQPQHLECWTLHPPASLVGHPVHVETVEAVKGGYPRAGRELQLQIVKFQHLLVHFRARRWMPSLPKGWRPWSLQLLQ